jgi:plasmid stabilization system protein ParE
VGFKIRFLEGALTDLDEICAYSWAHFPDTTPDFGGSILDHIYLLERFPWLGRPVARRRGVRMLVHTPVRIFYRVRHDDRVIEILEIRHASRRP